MNYISFYRKWRPQSFGEIIGQEHNIKTLRNAIRNNRLSHCYIFCGPRGTGKTSTARILSKALNCKKGITPDPCNKCENCMSISNGSSVDVVEIDAASNRGINEIRELREKVKYLPNILRKKVYIIDEVHMLTTEAFNALLKILEEPPEHVLFLMATTEPNKVIPTILSRCQRFDFSPISMDKIKERLKKIAGSEKIDIDESAIDIISKYADGSLRDADSILEQLAAFGGNKIEVKNVASLLGITDLDLLFELTDVLIERDLNRGFLLANKIIKSNHNLKVFVSEFLDYLYDLYVIKSYPDPFEIVNISRDYRKKYSHRAEKLRKEEIEFYMELFTDLLKQIKWGDSSRIFFKSALVKAINFVVVDEKEIIGKVSRMEAQIDSLKIKLDKINIKKVEPGRSGRKEEENTDNDYGNEDNDFDIINTDEIDKMVNDVGNKKSDKQSDKKSRKSNLEKTKSEKSSDVKKEQEGKGNGIAFIHNNMDEISRALKSRKVSVYAMFIEAKPDRLEDKILYFSLNKKKQWHKNHLNKSNNVDLISDVIKKVTGRSYIVRFEIKKESSGSKKEESKGIKNKKSAEVKNEGSAKSSGLKKTAAVKGGSVSGGNNKSSKNIDGGKDVLGYFEKKFNIKE
ncbi:MAG: DNA polymerase III subunit gamma/tau [Actinomycetota bacterium]|nr:DNA polymerase III subunit gamma/tau [Actinomycetota bacterium]